MKNLFENITPDDAYYILQRLVENDDDILKKAEDIAEEYFHEVDSDGIAEDVFFELDFLEVEELWDSSGSTRYGYVEPGERAYEIVEEVVQPYIDEMKKLQNIGQYSSCKEYCIGILKGLVKFNNESTTEFKQWAVDVPVNMMYQVGEEWKEIQNEEDEIFEMEQIIKELRV